MKGDFSKIRFRESNSTGVLHQQGRVLLDQDWNTAMEIHGRLRRELGQDAIGSGVFAVPEREVDSWRVMAAGADATGVVKINLHPGRGWIDGLLVELPTPVIGLSATYFGPPIQAPQAQVASIGPGVRDAVVLEVWEEAVSAFQYPDELLEPALGGPDTTERTQLFFALHLWRLADGESCESLIGHLDDELGTRGRLAVSVAPDVMIGGDCPIDAGGGYSGFEHYLYRVEIADPDPIDGRARFKWSRFNGGLVARGRFDPLTSELALTANDQMVDHAGRQSFHLEVLEQTNMVSPWRITFTADATWIGSGRLAVAPLTGAMPSGTAFVRLWDGIEHVADFVGPIELQDGIRLEFAPPSPASGANNYVPGDYWTFPVRAAGSDFDPSFGPSPPHGPVHHRAPLGVIEWEGPAPANVGTQAIEDCRRTFPSLTGQKGCCTFRVGDGKTSFGNFNRIQDAIDHLPEAGGQICLLPGTHAANVQVVNRRNVVVTGCGKQTRVVPKRGHDVLPLFHIMDSTCVKLERMDLITLVGRAIAVQGSAGTDGSREIMITQNRIIARDEAIAVENAKIVTIERNRIRMHNVEGAGVGIAVQAQDVRIERNDIRVTPAKPPPDDTPTPDDPEQPDPEDPCVDPQVVYVNPRYLGYYVNYAFARVPPAAMLAATPEASLALGGVQIAGSSEAVHVLDNDIVGGTGNGISLGGGLTMSPPPVLSTDPATRTTTVQGGGAVNGDVLLGNQPLAGINIVLTPPGAAETDPGTHLTTDAIGFFSAKLAGEAYRLTILDSRYRIENTFLTTHPRIPDYPLHNRILVSEVGEAPDPVLWPVRDVVISDNRIEEMGLNGIGMAIAPSTRPGTAVPESKTSRTLEQLRGGGGRRVDGLVWKEDPNVDDRIVEALRERPAGRHVATPQRIEAVLTAPSAGEQPQKTSTNGDHQRVLRVRKNPQRTGLIAAFGNLIEDLTIHRNRIARCMSQPFDDELLLLARRIGFGGVSLGICGRLDITENRIESNGLRHVDPICGIFVLAAAEAEVRHNHLIDNGPLIDTTLPIQDGRRGGIVIVSAAPSALTQPLKTRPSVSVSPDHIGNRVRIHDNIVRQPVDVALQLAISDGDATVADNTFVALGQAGSEPIAGTVLILDVAALREGLASSIQYHGNRVDLGGLGASFLAQLIWSSGRTHVSYMGNTCRRQSSRLVAPGFSLSVNTGIRAGSIAATNNRFVEPDGHAEETSIVSLMAESSLLNNVAHNQGDHCIIAVGGQVIEVHNQELDTSFCDSIKKNLVGKGVIFVSLLENLRYLARNIT